MTSDVEQPVKHAPKLSKASTSQIIEIVNIFFPKNMFFIHILLS